MRKKGIRWRFPLDRKASSHGFDITEGDPLRVKILAHLRALANGPAPGSWLKEKREYDEIEELLKRLREKKESAFDGVEILAAEEPVDIETLNKYVDQKGALRLTVQPRPDQEPLYLAVTLTEEILPGSIAARVTITEWGKDPSKSISYPTIVDPRKLDVLKPEDKTDVTLGKLDRSADDEDKLEWKSFSWGTTPMDLIEARLRVVETTRGGYQMTLKGETYSAVAEALESVGKEDILAGDWELKHYSADEMMSILPVLRDSDNEEARDIYSGILQTLSIEEI
jgi:hypothetical protein